MGIQALGSVYRALLPAGVFSLAAIPFFTPTESLYATFWHRIWVLLLVARTTRTVRYSMLLIDAASSTGRCNTVHVIYPIIPNRFVDPWHLINPRAAWVIVIVIAGIGFVNYVLLKLYGTRGIYVRGFLGGLVNSTAAAAELARPLGAGTTSSGVAVAALLLTIVAMFARNLIILAIFSPSAVSVAAAPLLVMALGALILVRRSRARVGDTPTEIHLESPVSLGHVLNFAGLFLLIQVVSTLGERHLGKFGFLGISILGGLVSSASTTAAAANMVVNGQLQADLAGTGVVLASLASALVNLPIIHRQAKNPALTRRLTLLTVALAVLGIAVLFLREYHWLFRKQ